MAWIRVALETLQRETIAEFDVEIRAAIESAEAQADRGEGVAVDEAVAQLRKKRFGS